MFVDANVLLEILLDRPKRGAAKKLLETHETELYISSLSVHTIVHFAASAYGLPVLPEFIGDFKVMSLDDPEISWAFNNARNNDFEDALQLAVAVSNNCQTFATFDKQLHKDYSSLPVIDVQLLV